MHAHMHLNMRRRIWMWMQWQAMPVVCFICLVKWTQFILVMYDRELTRNCICCVLLFLLWNNEHSLLSGETGCGLFIQGKLLETCKWTWGASYECRWSHQWCKWYISYVLYLLQIQDNPNDYLGLCTVTISIRLYRYFIWVPVLFGLVVQYLTAVTNTDVYHIDPFNLLP